MRIGKLVNRGNILLFLCIMLLLSTFSSAQGLINNGANIVMNGTSTTTANVYMNISGGTTGNYTSTGTGIISCTNIGYDSNADGSASSSITLSGNWYNNAATAGITGNGLTVVFNNASTTQSIGGSSVTSFFNLYCSGSAKTFNASSPVALIFRLNYSVNCPVNYSNITSININKLFLGSNPINSGSMPVTIGDDYNNTSSGYAVTGDWTYNGLNGGTLSLGALNYNNLIISSIDGGNKTAPFNGTATVAGTLTVNNKCTMQTNGNLTLLSTASATASVAALTGTASITGNVNVQRFVVGSYGRSYRLISSPVYNSTGFYNIASLIGYTPITGPNPGTGNFDASNTNNASVWMYREGDPFPANTVIKDSDYKGIYSLSENIPVGTGLLFFNRGSRTNLNTKLRGPVFPTPDDNAIVFTGTLNQGNISVKVPQNNINNFTVSSPYAKESPGSSLQSAYYYKYNASYAPAASLQRTNWYGTTGAAGDQATDGFNLIGNPYASTIDLDAVTFGSDVNNLVYVYNPINKQFSYYTKGSATSGPVVTDGNGASRYIASGQGFFARCNTVGSVNAGVTFSESNKVSTQLTASTSPVLLMNARPKGGLELPVNIMGAPTAGIFSTNQSSGISSALMLQLKTDSNNYDGIGLFFNKNWSAKFDQEDGSDMDGLSPNVYLSSYGTDKTRLAINKMPNISPNMRIKLYVDAATTASQQLLVASMANVAPKYTIYVIDHYKKDSVQIGLNNGYNFNINRADTSSLGGNRLELVFKLNPQGAYKLLSFSGKISSRNISLNWTTKNEAAYTVFTIQKSTDVGKTFTNIGTLNADGSGNYSFTDTGADNGLIYYRLKQTVLENEVNYSDLVTFSFKAVNANSFYVYPNPAINSIRINLPKNYKGKSDIRIINLAGITLQKASVSNNSPQFDISALKPGIYVIEAKDANQNVIGQTKFIKL